MVISTSTSSNTRGGLSPGSISSLSSSSPNTILVTVKFHFNPHEFSINKSNTWKEEDGQGNEIPWTSFDKGGAQTLSLSLHFDTQAKGTPVTLVTNPLWKMMLVESGSTDQRTEKGRPPTVEFSWGPLAFKSIITQMSEKFILFSGSGVPLRSVVDISLQQFIDKETTADELGLTVANVPAPAAQAVTSSDRIDLLAVGMTGSAAGWTALAAQNNIADPLKPIVGSTVSFTK